MVDQDVRTVSLPTPDGPADLMGGSAELAGDLVVPSGASGVVVFAHGSGSSRRSSRNRWVAEQLQRRGLATLLMDLLTADEDRRDARTGEFRFDIALLTRRVLAAIDWVSTQDAIRELRLGVFGASTGAAAALGAAAHRSNGVWAVVSRGGRPDLTGEDLAAVRAPALLIVGGRDNEVLRLNRQAAERLGAGARVQVVEGATHLFEEPGALDDVSTAAADWFSHHLIPERPQ